MIVEVLDRLSEIAVLVADWVVGVEVELVEVLLVDVGVRLLVLFELVECDE